MFIFNQKSIIPDIDNILMSNEYFGFGLSVLDLRAFTESIYRSSIETIEMKLGHHMKS